MSGAKAAIDALQEALRKHWQFTQDAGKAYAQAFLVANRQKDLVAVMRGTVEFIATVEALAETAAEAGKQARIALAAQMMDSGATHLEGDRVTAYLSRKPAFVSLDQPDLLPAEYLKTPEPTVDRKRIKQAIEAGEDVPGCSLVRPNEMQLNIRGKPQ